MMIKISRDIIIPSDVIGIDMGQTLTKIVYMENDNLQLVLMSTSNDYEKIKSFLISKKEFYNTLNFTGGKAFSLSKDFSSMFKTKLIIEFQANSTGVEILYKILKKKDIPPSLIVSIGTGTSMVLKKERFQHLGGSALGGGFFMAMVKLLFDIDDYDEIISLAGKGDRYGVDLKVGDIYDSDDDRIDDVFREFTAASFGKIEGAEPIKKEDIIHSLICVLGENLGMIAGLRAENEGVRDIIFCGGFTKENKILRNVISRICKFINRKRTIFLENSEYCGALGALMS